MRRGGLSARRIYGIMLPQMNKKTALIAVLALCGAAEASWRWLFGGDMQLRRSYA